MYEENGLWLVENVETNEVVYACGTEEKLATSYAVIDK